MNAELELAEMETSVSARCNTLAWFFVGIASPDKWMRHFIAGELDVW